MATYFVYFILLETKGIPSQSINNTGLLFLGYMENDSENLDIGNFVFYIMRLRVGSCFVHSDHPLAFGFPIRAGLVEVTMPEDIPPRKDYFVVREFGECFCSSYRGG